MRRSRALLCVLVAWSIVMVATALINVAEVFLAKQSYDSGDFGFGLLWTGSGIGLDPRRPRGVVADPPRPRRSPTCELLAIFALGVIGRRGRAERLGRRGRDGARRASGTAARSSRTSRSSSAGAEDRVRGRVFTLLMSVNYAVLGVAFVVAGPITNQIGARWIYAIAAVRDRDRRGRRLAAAAGRGERPAVRARRMTPARPGRASDARRGRPRRRHAARSRARSRSSRTATRRRTSSCASSTRSPGSAHAIGFTGPPGVGKSSLISALVAHVRPLGKTVGVDLGRPVEPVHAGRAARRPHPARRPLPRPGRLHPLDGHARPRGRPGRVDAAGAAAARRVRQGRRLPRDGRHRAERDRRALDRRHGRARADARLRRLGAGAEGRDHGDPRRDRDQQVRPPAGADDGERRAAGARARRRRRRSRRSCSPRRCAARASSELWAAIDGASRRARGRRHARGAPRAATSPRRCSRSPRRGRAAISRMPSPTTRSCARLLDEVERRELDPLTAVHEILETVFHLSDDPQTMATKTGPTLADIEAARERIGDRARVTAVYGSEALTFRDRARDRAQGREPPAHRLVQDPRRGQHPRLALAGRARGGRDRGERRQPRPGRRVGGARARACTRRS